VAQNEFTTLGGALETTGVLIIILGVILDLGLLGGSRRSAGRR
jgi:hypothetical protein